MMLPSEHEPSEREAPARGSSHAQTPHGHPAFDHPAFDGKSGDVSRCPFVRGFDAALSAFLGGDTRERERPPTSAQAKSPTDEPPSSDVVDKKS